MNGGEQTVAEVHAEVQAEQKQQPTLEERLATRCTLDPGRVAAHPGSIRIRRR